MTDKLDAKLDQAKGSVKEAYGKLTDDKKVEAEGLVDKVTGKVKEAAVDAKDAVEGFVEGLKK
ncbi:CsbD family protein [Streptococcus caprae]|uniref:CsbD family protein n=1 Tax=Streptococcus caprae TaxID=1640501 RepID=A0ABV8CSW1_9STRE